MDNDVEIYHVYPNIHQSIQTITDSQHDKHKNEHQTLILLQSGRSILIKGSQSTICHCRESLHQQRFMQYRNQNMDIPSVSGHPILSFQSQG